MNDNEAPLAVLFADVSGSTRLYETVGDAVALATIGRCLALVRTACEGYRGRVIKTIGDEVMAVFPSADLAAEAAAEMQQRLSEMPPAGSARGRRPPSRFRAPGSPPTSTPGCPSRRTGRRPRARRCRQRSGSR